VIMYEPGKSGGVITSCGAAVNAQAKTGSGAPRMVWGRLIVKDGPREREYPIDDFRIYKSELDARIANSNDVKVFPIADVISVIRGNPDGGEKKLERRNGITGIRG
jgi:hypothetical protein